VALWTRLEEEDYALVHALPHQPGEAFPPELVGWLPTGETFDFQVDFGEVHLAIGPVLPEDRLRAKAQSLWKYDRHLHGDPTDWYIAREVITEWIRGSKLWSMAEKRWSVSDRYPAVAEVEGALADLMSAYRSDSESRVARHAPPGWIRGAWRSRRLSERLVRRGWWG
jgi:hypothetical protein